MNHGNGPKDMVQKGRRGKRPFSQLSVENEKGQVCKRNSA